MPFDNNRIYRPDFQANTELPQWVPGMDDDGQTAAQTGSFVDALKARMGSGADKNIQPYTASPTSQASMGHEGLHSLAPKAKGGGGMSSL